MIQTFADWLVYTVFGMSPESHWGSAVNFFYDTIKITVLLFFHIGDNGRNQRLFPD